MKSILYIVVLILVASCTSVNDQRLEAALQMAGENRGELEKVLKHYEHDTLKLKAARFLIENMPQHFSYNIPNYERWKDIKVKSVRDDSLSYEDSIEVERLSLSLWGVKKIYDCEVVTSDFLIKNIDYSFKIWGESPWSKDYSFNDFCESILPYRIANEPLQFWKEEYHREFRPILDSLYCGSDIVKCCDVLVRYFSERGFPNNHKMKREPLVYDALFLKENRVGDCKESTSYFTYVMRSLGIPVNIDILFYGNDLKQAHYWSSVKNKNGITIPFWLEEDPSDVNVYPGVSDDERRPKWKIYRQVYKAEYMKYPKELKDHYLLNIFESPFLRDATSDYYGENKLTVKSSVDNQLVFLSRHYMLPIEASMSKNGTATFCNVGPDMVYFLYYYLNGKLTAAGFPFYFKGEDLHYFIPNEKRKRMVSLTRKTKLSYRVKKHLNSVIGLKLERQVGSSGNWCWKSLLEVKDSLRTNSHFFKLRGGVDTRYIKCSQSFNKKVELAELIFFRDFEGKDTIHFSVKCNNNIEVLKIVDNDPLSYFLAENISDDLYVDFGKRESLKSVDIIPRNDDNFIRIGDEYELFYYIGKGWGWKSLGLQKANSNFLRYEVPDNALFWLKNKTRGYEEQLFYCNRDGSQVFLR